MLHVCCFLFNCVSLCVPKTKHYIYSLVCLRHARENFPFPACFQSDFILFLFQMNLSFNLQVQRRGERLFWLCSQPQWKKGGWAEFCVLIFRPTVMLWVLRGLKDITKLICPLHRQPCSALPCSASRLPAAFLPLCLLSEARGAQDSSHRGITPQRLAAHVCFGCFFSLFWSFVPPGFSKRVAYVKCGYYTCGKEKLVTWTHVQVMYTWLCFTQTLSLAHRYESCYCYISSWVTSM